MNRKTPGKGQWSEEAEPIGSKAGRTWQDTTSAAPTFGPLNHEQIGLAITVFPFPVFALILQKFPQADNILALARGAAVRGILGLGMLIVVLGRGIDLSLVANMAISSIASSSRARGAW